MPVEHKLFGRYYSKWNEGLPYLHPGYPLDHELRPGDVGFFTERGHFIWLFHIEDANGSAGLESISGGIGLELDSILSFEKCVFTSGGIKTDPEQPAKGDIKIILDLDSTSEPKSEAFIACQTPAIRQRFRQEEHGKVMTWMKDNRQAWYNEFAVKRGYKMSHKDDLVVVTGLLKTKSWAMGFFPNRTALGNGELLVAQGRLDEDPTELLDVTTPAKSCFVQAGPPPYKCRKPSSNGMNQSADQTVFLRYFKAKTRWFTPRVDARAGPHRLPFPDRDGPYSVKPQRYTSNNPGSFLKSYPLTPLDSALEFILKYNEECNVAIACNTDLFYVFPNGWPEDPETTLITHVPHFNRQGPCRNLTSLENAVLRMYCTRALQKPLKEPTQSIYDEGDHVSWSFYRGCTVSA